MGDVENLFVLNPLVHSGFKKYVWLKKDGMQKEGALAVFWELIVKEEVYVEGFATDEEEYIGKMAFNKAIVDIKKLDPEEDVVFVEQEYEEKLYDICKPITIVNSNIGKGRIVIFGAGKYGVEVYKQLARRGFGEAIDCFVDSDEVKCGRHEEGLMICKIDTLLKLAEDVSIIEASEMHDEMETMLKAKGVVQKRFFYVDQHRERFKMLDQYYDNIKFRITCLDELCSKISGKNIYYYGKRDDSAEKTARCLKLLDFRFTGFLHDGIESKEDDDYIVEDILYDEDAFVLVDRFYSQKQRKRLQELGLKVGKDYNVLDMNCYHKNMDNLMLDLNLGYTYEEGEKYSGFAIYGEENENDYKIVTLGGSTTDGNLNWEKSWPYFLYEKLCLTKKVTVYNGGIAGYHSGQELLKLIRDVLPLKPDMVIVYDSHNDIGIADADRPYAFSYLKDVFSFAGKNMNISDSNMKIDEGIKSGKTVFENWLSNIEMMHAIAELRGIKFYSFVQPSRIMMYTSKKVDEWAFSHLSFWIENCKRAYMDFREELKDRKIEQNYEYITDLTDLFDDKPEVYMDAAHVYEEGNKIIADKVASMIERGVLSV